MARTHHHAQTMRGLERCPPRWWRRAFITRPERREGHRIEMLALRVSDPDDLPPTGRVRARPWYT